MLLLELLDTVRVSNDLRVIPFGLCRLSNGNIKKVKVKGLTTYTIRVIKKGYGE